MRIVRAGQQAWKNKGVLVPACRAGLITARTPGAFLGSWSPPFTRTAGSKTLPRLQASGAGGLPLAERSWEPRAFWGGGVPSSMMFFFAAQSLPGMPVTLPVCPQGLCSSPLSLTAVFLLLGGLGSQASGLKFMSFPCLEPFRAPCCP